MSDGITRQELGEELRSAIIEENGSNDRGSYTKFADGIMICNIKGQVTMPTMTQNPINGLWNCALDYHIQFPATFHELPWWEMKLQLGEEINCARRVTTTLSFNPRIYTTVDKSGSTIDFDCVAIGRWK